MVVPFLWFVPKIRMGLLELEERSPNASALVLSDQRRKHLPEVRVLGARMDVLPTISLEQSAFDTLLLALMTAVRCHD
jgi:hypothetical protein